VSIVDLPEELAQRPAAEAERHQMSIDDLASEIVGQGLRGHGSGLESFIGSAGGEERVEAVARRRLAFASMGLSGSERSGADADELLSDRFRYA
jgi:hypothetical protein